MRMKKETHSIVSDAIEKVVYDHQNAIMTLFMRNNPPKNHGEVLTYADIPLDVFQAFLSADSKGRFFNKFIKDSFTLI